MLIIFLMSFTRRHYYNPEMIAPDNLQIIPARIE